MDECRIVAQQTGVEPLDQKLLFHLWQAGVDYDRSLKITHDVHVLEKGGMSRSAAVELAKRIH